MGGTNSERKGFMSSECPRAGIARVHARRFASPLVSLRRIQRAHREGNMLWEDMVAALDVHPEPYPDRYLVIPVAG